MHESRNEWSQSIHAFLVVVATLAILSSSALWPATLCPRVRAESNQATTVTRDIEFARPDGRPLLLDLYQGEESATRSPVIIFVHGGGWKNGSRKSAA